jgi:AcrR family transcriptional regulator
VITSEKDDSGQRKPSAKAEAILDGAMQEFLTYGYAATSMDRVAQSAKVSKATIYSHFRDKADLFTAIVQRLAEYKFNILFDPHNAQSLQGEPRQVLRTLALNLCHQASQDDQFCEFMRLIVGESGRFPELAKPYVEKVARPVIQALTQYLTARSELSLQDPEATARIFVGTLVYFIVLQEVLHGKDSLPMSHERLIDNLIDLIVPVR